MIGSRGRVEIDPRDTMQPTQRFWGCFSSTLLSARVNSIHAALAAGLENGTLRPIVGREMPLSDAPLAHHAIMQPGAYGKIVLIP